MIAEGDLGGACYALAAEIYPLCRSITGNGVRQTLDILARHIPLERVEVPTGTPMFDWTAPREWNIRDAWVKDPSGRKVIDFKASNLHVLNYSVPVHKKVSLAELKEHCFTLPDQPDLIPYRTSYHAERWGFCLSHRALSALPEGTYEVFIDSDLSDGSLTYGEYLHEGQSGREFLLSAHICHPSLANDNCSGLALLTLLARTLRSRKTRYSYRFLFAPGTVGALAWLSANEDRLAIDHGLVVSCVGDSGGPTYKSSRRGDAFIDRAMRHVLEHSGLDPVLLDFSPYGYDERQYCSPGFDLPVGLFQRSAFGTFPEYHTSADNLDFIAPEHLRTSFDIIMKVIEIVEADYTPVNLSPKGEPQLGRRGLYSSIGGDSGGVTSVMPLLWVLNLADGKHTLLDMAERSGMPFGELLRAAQLLREADLLT
ncbi:DUF4910 domain-containing protein [Oricola thermophila]|uniref:DUF4910 domain-containing protein n=1 Tax=Oricola thermophila TaxID=2742145 RepID=A0A6N1VM81_9HYPH|nr:DUF4910 domain-containing protein [Oricola thermophila]QKV20542.1 DUF4910 domain-containing protein [Oricola thermophila]